MPKMLSFALTAFVCLAVALAAAAEDAPARNAVDGTPFIDAAELEGGAVDFGLLDAARKARAVELLNDTLCDCGCKMSLARCRRDDKSCPRSPQVVPILVAQLAAGRTDAEAVKIAMALDDPKIAFPVTAGDSPSTGPADAPVTLVVWVDYQCPFCARVQPALQKIRETYPKDVRLVIKQNPLAMHPHAQGAAEAALAANAQGRFWPLHDKMLAATREVSPDKIREWAGELGIDVAKMDADLAAGKHRAQVASEQATAVGLGATGTPASFVNGRFITGAKDFDYFAKRIDEEIAWAKAGDRPEFKQGRNVSELKPQRKDSGQPDPTVRHDVRPGTTPAKGATDAKVDIVLWTDYQCPFCKRIEPELDKVLADNPDTVRLFVRQHPLAMHADAMPAAQAALAASAQGRFWEMHEKLFENPRDLKRPAFERMAQELGLDLDRFRADLDGGVHEAAVQADVADAKAVKATFTPAVFVGGYLVKGGGAAVQAKVAELLAGGPAATAKPVAAAAPVLTASASLATRPTPAVPAATAEVTAAALKLSPADRARLAADLLASLQGELK